MSDAGGFSRKVGFFVPAEDASSNVEESAVFYNDEDDLYSNNRQVRRMVIVVKVLKLNNHMFSG